MIQKLSFTTMNHLLIETQYSYENCIQPIIIFKGQIKMSLIELGLSSIFTNDLKIDNDDFSIARVTSVNKESYYINNGRQDYFAKLTGNLLYSSDTPDDFPTVGDFVLYQSFDDESLAIVHKVLKRKTLLKRKSAGKKIEYQLIAANIDFAIIIQALDNDLNVNRLERYLSMTNEFGVEPIILFSKSDLITKDEKSKIIEKISSRIAKENIHSFSNYEPANIVKIKQLLQKGKTYCLIGSSGVGKTTLLNNLIGHEEFKTLEVREGDSKGKHSTTNRQLVVLENGAMIIDTPGMRELGNFGISEGIDQTFDEISELTNNCKFTDCTHTIEKGCAVLAALENGDLEKSRYDNYIKLKKESEYYERSYLERKRRDKEFGKMVKTIMKNIKKK